MKKILYTLLLFLAFIACNDDKEDEPEIDTFDYNVLDEELNEQHLKIYDGDTVLETKDIFLGHWLYSATDRTLHLHADIDNQRLMMSWEDNLFQDISNGKDTFDLFAQYPKYMQYAKKGIIVIKNMKYRSANSYNPPAVSDSIFIEAAFNIRVDDSTERIVKGVFYYDGELGTIF